MEIKFENSEMNLGENKMAGNRTRDGIRIGRVVRALEGIDGVSIRPGTNHLLVAFAQGSTRPCPIATSTHARRMVVPWVKEVTPYSDVNQIYSSLRNGRRNYQD